jgi:hypothetical protein
MEKGYVFGFSDMLLISRASPFGIRIAIVPHFPYQTEI